ncbi:PorV/PorQ family protein [Cytophagales bacterium LB-30]|uniref:PorV/PorQ family protein n=1 Tax=Shiella aurantiaca TaxID=3058365 RepID=A0ABT8F7X5_9BACT|nr:PorV/PorQ family protein [Shiella aurantiaca]
MTPIVTWAQLAAPKYSNEFLSIGVGARGLAMSKAQVAITGDNTSLYWNPAGLMQAQGLHNIGLMHASYFGGIAQYDYLGYTTYLDKYSKVGVGLIRFGVDNIPDTRFLYDASGVINYDNVRFFAAADYALLLSYARNLAGFKGLSLGGNAKVIHRLAGDFANAWGFGLDFGAQYRAKNWSAGLMARDVTTTFNAWSHNAELVYDVYLQTGNEIPRNSIEITLPKLILGGAYWYTFLEDFTALISLDAEITFDGPRNVLLSTDPVSADPMLGLELSYDNLVYLRGGLGGIQQIKDFDGSQSYIFQPSAGLGINWRSFQLDYALTNIGQQSQALYSHVFSLNLRLEEKEE